SRDPLWAHGLELLKCAYFWNPAVFAWSGLVARVQEFACDEALVGRRGLSPQEYGRCLLRAAESAVESRCLPAGTTGMAAGISGSLLKRRIKMILLPVRHSSRGSIGRWLLSRGLVLGTLATLASAALTARGATDRTLTLEEARDLARAASTE